MVGVGWGWGAQSVPLIVSGFLFAQRRLRRGQLSKMLVSFLFDKCCALKY